MCYTGEARSQTISCQDITEQNCSLGFKEQSLTQHSMSRRFFKQFSTN